MTLRIKNFKVFDPEWHFGYGLRFTYSDLEISQSFISDKDELKIFVLITHSGDHVSQEVIQFYISDDVASLVPVGKKLK